MLSTNSKKTNRITEEGILAAIDEGALTLTAVAHALGYKGSISGSVSKRIREAVPDIDEKLEAPATKQGTGKAKGTKIDKPNPYRKGSGYAACFDCLRKMGLEKPVSRKDLLAEYVKSREKEERLAKYDLAVVLSPTKDGEGHRSSRKEAYYVERLPVDTEARWGRGWTVSG